jgi:hypothetical protein
VTDATRCRRCGTENPPGLTFCANCGQRLVDAEEATMARPGSTAETAPCPRCGASNRSGAAFCSECGFNIRLAVPPAGVPLTAAAAGEEPQAPVAPAATSAGRAWLGPVVLVTAAIGMATAWLLPFAFGAGSLAEQALGADGFGIAFWTAYPEDAGLLESAYYAIAAPLPILVGLLLLLAVAGVIRAAPGRLQRFGLVLALVWCTAFAVLFLVVEVGSGLGGGLLDLLRGLSPAGLIGFLSGIIGAIGSATRLAGG